MKHLAPITIAVVTLFVVTFSAQAANYQSPILQQDYTYQAKNVDRYIHEAAQSKQARIQLAFENASGEGLREAFMPLLAEQKIVCKFV